MTGLISRAFALWMPFLVAITGFFLFAVWAVQQNYRQSLNDPQVQMAEDAAASLAANYLPAAVVPRTNPQSAGAPSIEMSTSLAPWITVYDASGTPLESSATLDGAPPQLPQGVFDRGTWKRVYAEWGIALSVPANETRFSWQPRPGVRQAVVLVQFQAPHGTGYVAAGRNTREVENREATLIHGAALLFGATSLATLAAIVILLALGWL
ncbi:hypothetical protein KGQ72_03275 [Patescibacteria group bacterium]|nr:hypothetical protein [Patescibacteria group bacterium]